MKCQEINDSLQALIDNALDRKALRAVKGHLAVCEGCRKEYRLLMKVSAGLNRLDLYEPSRDFNQAVFRRLGLEYRPHRHPLWLGWSLAGSLSLLAAWIAAVAVALPWLVMGAKPYKLVQWLQHPGEALTSVQTAVVKSGFAILEAAGLIAKVLGWLAKSSSLPAQLAVSSLVAFALIALAMRTIRPQMRIG